MAARARITLGIALLLAVLAMIIREIHWLAALLTFFGLFLIVWGRLPNETEKAITQLPRGEAILKGLDQLDMILVPRDQRPLGDPQPAKVRCRMASLFGRWSCGGRFFRPRPNQGRISRADKEDTKKPG